MHQCNGAAGACRDVPVILTIAGSDSGGGAGIQADLKTMTLLGGFGTSVLAALTAQNGAGVIGIHEVPEDFILLQLKAVREGFPVRAAKTGMLASVPIIRTLSKALEDRDFPLVVDPVCVSQSGHRLLREDAESALRECMIPVADLLTPNKPEAELLAGMAINNEADVREAVRRLLDLGARAVLLKGGHFEEYEGKSVMIDWLGLPGEDIIPLPHQRVETVNNHGTGCTLSAALATFLGLGLSLRESVEKAQIFLTAALAAAYSPGIGCGPPNLPAGAKALRRAE